MRSKRYWSNSLESVCVSAPHDEEEFNDFSDDLLSAAARLDELENERDFLRVAADTAKANSDKFYKELTETWKEKE